MIDKRLYQTSLKIIEELYSHGNIPAEKSSTKIHKYQNQTISTFYNILSEWITDCYGKPINRFQQFDLYKMIARRMKCTVPLKQLKRPHFKKFLISKHNFIKNNKNPDSISYNITKPLILENNTHQNIHHSSTESEEMSFMGYNSDTSSNMSCEHFFGKDMQESLNLSESFNLSNIENILDIQ